MKTVLVVEDNDDIREYLVEVLRGEGCRVHEAEHGERALEVLAALGGEPCLVLLDLMMPVMSGSEFIEALGHREIAAPLAVVVVSASVMGHLEGCQRVLKKPIMPETIKALVREFCDDPAPLLRGCA